MKKLKINKILLSASLVFALNSLVSAKNIELKSDFYELDVQADKMLVIDFPFKILDHQFLGDSSSVAGDKRDNSIYLSIKEGTVDVSVWGGEKPILLTLTAKENKGERKISFYSIEQDIKNIKKESKEWNHDIRVAEQIESYSKTNNLAGFKKEDIDGIFTIGNRLSIVKLEKLTNAKHYAFEKLSIKNISDKVIDLFQEKTFYFTQREDYIIDAVSFDDRYILPGQQTICYLGLEKR